MLLFPTHHLLNLMSNAVCQPIFLRLYRISPVQFFRSVFVTMFASVLSPLDDCDCLLVDLPDPSLGKIQKAQNNLARTVLCEQKADHTSYIIPLLWASLAASSSLNWLQIATLATIVFNGSILAYLSATGVILPFSLSLPQDRRNSSHFQAPLFGILCYFQTASTFEAFNSGLKPTSLRNIFHSQAYCPTTLTSD